MRVCVMVFVYFSRFANLWTVVEMQASTMNSAPPALRRNARAPRRIQTSEPHQFASPKENFRVDYYSVVDSTINCLEKRISDKALPALIAIENIIISGWHGLPVADSELQAVSQQYGDDIDIDRLKSQVQSLENFPRPTSGNKSVKLDDVLSIIGKSDLTVMIPQVVLLAQLYLINPATTATAERSFSRLRRLRTYLRSTMTQSRLNHLFILNMYQEFVDSLDMNRIANEFINSGDEKRRNAFALL